MIRAAWIRHERAAHNRALGAPQAFPLTGDGENARRLTPAPDYSAPIRLGGCDPSTNEGEKGNTGAIALAEARYRDWQEQRRNNQK